MIAFLDQDGHELYDWATTANTKSLAAEATADFALLLPSPPEVRQVEIRFAKAKH